MIKDPYFRRIAFEAKALQAEAEGLQLPDDIPALIDAWLKHAESIPDELEQKPLSKKYLRLALKQYHEGDLPAVRLYLLKARKLFENAQDDEWALDVAKQFGQNAERLKKQREEKVYPKHQKWVQIADEILANRTKPLSKLALARQIKAYLDLHDPEQSGSVRSIRRIIK